MSAAAVTKQNDTEMVAGIMRVIMALADVEASLNESCVREERLYLHYRREELVMRLAALGAGDVLARAYRSRLDKSVQ